MSQTPSENEENEEDLDEEEDSPQARAQPDDRGGPTGQFSGYHQNTRETATEGSESDNEEEDEEGSDYVPEEEEEDTDSGQEQDVQAEAVGDGSADGQEEDGQAEAVGDGPVDGQEEEDGRAEGVDDGYDNGQEGADVQTECGETESVVAAMNNESTEIQNEADDGSIHDEETEQEVMDDDNVDLYNKPLQVHSNDEEVHMVSEVPVHEMLSLAKAVDTSVVEEHEVQVR